jgi:DNA repair protein RadC
MTTLYVRDGAEFRVAESKIILERADRLILSRLRVGAPVLNQPEKIHHFLRHHSGRQDFEVFGLIHFDCLLRLIAVEDLFRGTIDRANVYAREVVRSAIQHNSHSLVVFHNHPSGSVEPSPADEELTHRLKAALQTVDIRLLDHLVVGETVYSFADHGLL